MEGRETTTTTKHGNPEADQRLLNSSKPLHRFVQKEPRSLGIVILIFGCAELLMGIHLAGEELQTSSELYTPFWEGVLFLICGSLSIYTELHPSKKMVTVCLSMYVVTIFGIVVSVGHRIHSFAGYTYSRYRSWGENDEYYSYRVNQVFCVEAILCTYSLCVSVLLIFLCVISRLALKSTRTQVILQCIPAPQSEATSN
ncbi:membrane-spanning 4-domains subfamily A member 4D-like [Brachionichthys hirsutus]|uniref:membrane-spanning 4-domains subfamily A member 4D-like n=1 Tax=Brachionichthys hirsutus TaxID=412623 RepID=UPI0036050D1E